MLRNVAGGIAACSGFAMQSAAAAELDLEPAEAEGTVEFEKGSVLSQLNSLGLITDSRKRPGPKKHSDGIPQNSGTLLEKLASDGLIDQASTDVLPIRKLDEGEDGYYHIRVEDHKEVGFILQIPSGKLQVKFDEKIPPVAFLLSNDGTRPIKYIPRREGGYQSKTMSGPIASSSDQPVDTNAIADDCEYWCGGCSCGFNPIICPSPLLAFHITCQNCWRGECIVTDNCVSYC